MEVLEIIAGTGLDYAFLLFIRVSGLILSSPIFGRQNIPQSAKIAYSLALTYFFFTTVPPQYAPALVGSVFGFVLLCALELLLGLVMGFLLTMFFSIAFVSGQMIDMQMGFGMANVFDVQSNASVPLIGNMLNIMMLLIFFAVDGHQHLIGLMYLTILRIPIGAVAFVPELGLMIAQLFSTAFLLAVQMTMPMVASGIIGEAILGVIIRTVPQMNVFNVGMPLKVLLGFVVLMLVLPVYGYFTEGIFQTMFEGIEQVFGLAAGA